jgi:tetratricopeptide (TPR) repeat protein
VRQGDKSWPAKIEQIDLHADLTRLRVSGLKVRGVDLRPSSSLDVGERVYSIGSPEGLELSISEGLISGLRELDDERVIQTTAAISHGSSGGGLFDSQGNLVGITTFMFTGGQNLNFAVPAEAIMEPTTPLNSALIDAHANPTLSYAEAVRLFGKVKIDADLKDVQVAQEALKRDPNNADAHAMLGDRSLLLDPYRAIRELNEALRAGANDAGTHFDLGVALRKVGDPYGAIAELRRSVEMNPTSFGAHNVLMDALMDDEAPTALVLKEAKVLARLNPMLALLYFPAAKWMAENGDKDSGMEVCKEILNVDRLKAFGHYCIGIVQWLGDPSDREQSVAEFRQAVLLGDGFENFHHTLAIALELTGRYEEAVQEYKRATEFAPNEPIAKGDYESAVTELQTGTVSDRNAPNFGESTARRRKLEGEIDCDATVLLKCPDR